MLRNVNPRVLLFFSLLGKPFSAPALWRQFSLEAQNLFSSSSFFLMTHGMDVREKAKETVSTQKKNCFSEMCPSTVSSKEKTTVDAGRGR